MTREELLQVIEQAATEEWTQLDLSGNELTEFPPEIGKLTQLKKLILGKREYDDEGGYIRTVGNKLSALPPEIGLLNQLEELQIVGNQLKSTPLQEQLEQEKNKSLNITVTNHNHIHNQPTSTSESKAMNEKNDRSFNAGRDVNTSGNQAPVTLNSEISGRIDSIINQIPPSSDSEKSGIK